MTLILKLTLVKILNDDALATKRGEPGRFSIGDTDAEDYVPLTVPGPAWSELTKVVETSRTSREPHLNTLTIAKLFLSIKKALGELADARSASIIASAKQAFAFEFCAESEDGERQRQRETLVALVSFKYRQGPWIVFCNLSDAEVESTALFVLQISLPLHIKPFKYALWDALRTAHQRIAS